MLYSKQYRQSKTVDEPCTRHTIHKLKAILVNLVIFIFTFNFVVVRSFIFLFFFCLAILASNFVCVSMWEMWGKGNSYSSSHRICTMHTWEYQIIIIRTHSGFMFNVVHISSLTKWLFQIYCSKEKIWKFMAHRKKRTGDGMARVRWVHFE